MRAGRLFLVLVALWLVLPAALFALYSNDVDGGLVWFFLHQLYYAPFGTWIREPFFTPDSEVGFWAQPMGRILAAVVYLFALLLLRVAVLRMLRSRRA
jgi:hypothetical protein